MMEHQSYRRRLCSTCRISVRRAFYVCIFFSFCALLWLYDDTLRPANLNLPFKLKFPVIYANTSKSAPLSNHSNGSTSSLEREVISTKQRTQPRTTTKSNANLEQKTILSWYVPFGDKTMPLRFFNNDRDKIDVRQNWETTGFEINTPLCGKCRITFDRSELNASSAVILHARSLKSVDRPKDLPPPSSRKKNQLYVWWCEESAVNTGQAGKLMIDFFNVTMFIRRSSDIYSPYLTFRDLLYMIWKKQNGVDLQSIYNKQLKQAGLTEMQLQAAINNLPRHSMATKFDEIPSHISREVAKLLKKKDRNIAWIVTNCDYTAGSVLRYTFSRKLLAAGLVVDQFGNCNKKSFPARFLSDPAFYEVLSKYKFYLAMENSFHCKDYLTEKIWYNALYSGAVPVVYGAHKDDVVAVLPPKSFIHIEDFANLTELVKYLNYLDKNATAYAEYLEWRNLVKFFDNGSNIEKATNQTTKEELFLWNKYAQPIASGYCGLCKRLHETNHPHQVVHRIEDMINEDREECLHNNLAKLMLNKILT